MNETLLWIYCYSNPAPVSLSRRNLAGTGTRYWCTRVRREDEEVSPPAENIRSCARHSSNGARPREKRRRLRATGGAFSEVLFWMCSLIKWHKSSRCLQDGTRTQLLRLTLKCHVPRYLLAASAPGSRVSPTRFLTLHGKTQCGRSMSCGLFHDVMHFRWRKPSEKGERRHLSLARCSSRGWCYSQGNAFFVFSNLAFDIVTLN